MKNSGQEFNRFRRVSIVTAKWSIGVLFALLLAITGINCFDEDLSSEAKNLLVAPPNSYASEENLYLTMLGFEALSGKSMLATGQARLAVHEAEVAAALKDPQSMRRVLSDRIDRTEEKLVFEGEIDICRPMTQSCLADVEVHKAEIAQLLKANSELYRRYLSLHKLNGYYETATPSFLVMVPYVPTKVRELFLANVASRVTSGNRSQRKAAIADLRDDIRTWQRVLTGSGSLISKMLSVHSLQTDYALLADIIAEGEFDPEYFSVGIGPLLDLIDQKDWKIGEVFIFEYRVATFLWDQMRNFRQLQVIGDSDEEYRKWWELIVDQFASVFIKFNATQNLDAKVKETLIK